MSDAEGSNNIASLLRDKPHVVNVGLSFFADDLKNQGIAVIDIDWSPPAGGDPVLADLLSKLGT
ncbi:MAG: hypothetical protein GY791_12525 [Alphaproteobacteria bacterium]|nr:hypothetical protein [Alphaproteobacteria bacterium]